MCIWIKQINISSGTHSGNRYLVELNLFQIPGDNNKRNYTYQANCCIMPGFYDSYNVGDRVYVSFLHDEVSIPIILGKIYQGRTDGDSNYRSYISCQSLEVANSVRLPKDTNIGDITYERLVNLFRQQSNIYYNHIISCNVGDDPKTIIKFKLQNRIKNGYTDLKSVIEEIKRINNTCSISCDIYGQKADLTYAHNNRGYIYVEDSNMLHAVIGTDVFIISNMVEDQVIEI